MCDTASQPVSNLITEARGVLERNHGRWPEADWQTLDQFVRVASELVDRADQLIDEPDSRIIETVEQLDTLPVTAVVKEIRIMPSGKDLGYVWERWNGSTVQWMKLGLPPDRSFPSAEIHLPALLLWHPENDR